MIKIYGKNEAEYGYLESAAELLTRLAKSGTTYEVDDIYFDFGAGIKWTTIVARKPNGDSWQALNPREHEMIVSGDVNQFAIGIEMTVDSKYNPDKH